MRLLALSQVRHLLHHRLQTLLAVLGIALGVAVVNAVDISNYSAQQNLRNAAEQLDGGASHRIVGAHNRLDEALYAQLRRQLLSSHPDISLSPIISSKLYSPRGTAHWQLFGIDPLSDGRFARFDSDGTTIDIKAFLQRSNSVLISRSLAEEMRVSIGDSLPLPLSDRTLELYVAGIIALDYDNRQLLIMDIGNAQSITAMAGYLSHIDVSIPPERPDLIDVVLQQLPQQTQLLSTGQLLEGQLSLISALNFNLSAMSLLAVVVGVFLIFSTVRFSVLQRIPSFARLRVQGVTDNEIQQLLVKEALLLASAGIILGWLLGFLLSQVLAPITNRTINDLYWAQLTTGNWFHWSLYLKTGLMGVVTTVLTSQLCYRGIRQLALSHTIVRVQQEFDSQQQQRLQLLLALSSAIAAALLLTINQHLYISYLAVCLLVLATMLFIPSCVTACYPAAQNIAKTLFGSTGLIALRDCQREASRVLLAIMALSLAVAATNGIATMVDSFRGTVNEWMQTQLGADIYLRSNSAQAEAANIAPEVIAILKREPEIQRFFMTRMTRTLVNNKWLPLNAVDTWTASAAPGESPPTNPADNASLIGQDPQLAWNNMRRGQLIISEPLARKHDLGQGKTLSLITPKGIVDFTIAGVMRDYGAEHGRIIIDRQQYQAQWQDSAVNTVGIYLKNPQQKKLLLERWEGTLAEQFSLQLVDSEVVRATVKIVFERTFAITRVLQILVLIIAVIAIVSTLMIYQLQRREQLLTLRALGMTAGELRKIFVIQGGFIGAMAGLIAIPFGILVAWLLVAVINPAAFGWSLDFRLDPLISLWGFSVAFLSGLLSAVYPSIHFGRAANISELNRE